jgi:hypothetical protein
MDQPPPDTDSRHPADVVNAMVEHVIDLVQTWTVWDGTRYDVEVEGEDVPRIYTPHKAVRRVCDHLLDHLAEIQARAAGQPTEPDRWHGSLVTTPADVAAFTGDDRDEAVSRLQRLGQMWDLQLRAMTDSQLDARDGEAWSPRQVAFHVSESAFYADTVGRLPR